MYRQAENRIFSVMLTGLFLLIGLTAYAQKPTDSVLTRIILIGDAGEMDTQQGGVITHAAGQVLKHNTTVFYLGDNIYPRGMGLPGSREEQETRKIISSQYTPFRRLGTPVYFIPGNHDWDKSGPMGLDKVRRQGSFLKEQGDPMLKLVPDGGCPGPVEIPIGKDMVVIAFDSEWWVFPHYKDTKGCDCHTKGEVIEKMKTLFEKNRGKIIVLASHHPFQSYGSHGGYFSLRDHLFPLTGLNRKLYLPLPVIGSLYPFLRTAFVNPEDLKHPHYKEMIRRIDEVFGNYADLIHVAGHDHGLQFILNGGIQVVSGSGAKHSYVSHGKHALYASVNPGYVVVDRLINNYVRFTYYANTGSKFEQVFNYLHAIHNAKSK